MRGGGGLKLPVEYLKGWHRFDPMRASGMPRLPACYAIYMRGELVYVGQTVDLRNRFYEHNFRCGYAKNIHHPWGELPDDADVFLKAKFCGRYGSWAMRELRLIRRLRPTFNRHHSRRKVAA